MKLPFLVAALATTPAVAHAGGVAIFEGPPSGPGNVAVVDPSGVGGVQHPPALQGIRLLPFEVNGRTEIERFLAGGVWLESDVPGASRAVLPASQGSLYHFACDVAGGTRFGFFVVDENGDARMVFQRLGVGPLSDTDPFTARPSIARDGKAMLVATRIEAGGDLFEVDLETGAALNRTASLAPQVFTLRGLVLGATFGAGVSDVGVSAFPRLPGAQASAVSFGANPPAWFQGDAVLSPTGKAAAVIAGDVAPLGVVWLFDASGVAVAAGQTPMELSGAGFLPEADHGPYLALSDDAGTCLWRAEFNAAVPPSREAFMARVTLGSAQQVTADAFFTDTIDEVGQYIFKPGSATAVVAVGGLSSNAPFGIENVDYFEVGLDAAGAPVFTNLTQTSGDTQPPFLTAGQMTPLFASWLPDRSALVLFDDKSEELLAVRPGQIGASILQTAIKEVDRVDRAGAVLYTTVRRSSGNKDRELHLLPQGGLGSTQTLFQAPDTEDITRAAGRSDGRLAFVHTRPTFESVWMADPVSGQSSLMTTRPLVYGPTLSIAPSGDVAFTVGILGNNNVYGRWPYPALPKRLFVPQGPGFVLPGA